MSDTKSTASPVQRSAKTIAEFRAAYGFSPNTWKRLRRAGDIPRLTWLTKRKAIIRPEHEREWLDARTDPAPAPSPAILGTGLAMSGR
jgi:hypothetical protein